MMGRRLSGLLLMLRALAPVLSVVIIGVTVSVILADVRAAAARALGIDHHAGLRLEVLNGLLDHLQGLPAIPPL